MSRGGFTDPPEALLNPRFFRNGIVMLALVIVALAVVFTVVNQTSSSPDAPYSQFLDNVAHDKVAKVQQEGSTLTVTPKPDASTYTVIVPGLLANQVLPDMQTAVGAGKPVPIFSAKAAPDNGWISIL